MPAPESANHATRATCPFFLGIVSVPGASPTWRGRSPMWGNGVCAPKASAGAGADKTSSRMEASARFHARRSCAEGRAGTTALEWPTEATLDTDGRPT